MDNKLSLNEQLEIAIQRRDIAKVKQILQLSKSSKNTKRFQKQDSSQVLLAISHYLTKGQGDSI